MIQILKEPYRHRRPIVYRFLLVLLSNIAACFGMGTIVVNLLPVPVDTPALLGMIVILLIVGGLFGVWWINLLAPWWTE